MQNNHTGADEELVRGLVRVLNAQARKIFLANAARSTPDNTVVVPFFFLVDVSGLINAIPATPAKDLTSALVRAAITPKTIAVINLGESFSATVQTENVVPGTVKDLPGAVEKILCLAETRTGLVFAIEQKIDRSGTVPTLSAPKAEEWREASGRLAGWFDAKP